MREEPRLVPTSEGSLFELLLEIPHGHVVEHEGNMPCLLLRPFLLLRLVGGRLA